MRASQSGADVNFCWLADNLECYGNEAKRAGEMLKSMGIKALNAGDNPLYGDEFLVLVVPHAQSRKSIDLITSQYSVALLEGTQRGTGFEVICVVPTRGEAPTTPAPRKQSNLWDDD